MELNDPLAPRRRYVDFFSSILLLFAILLFTHPFFSFPSLRVEVRAVSDAGAFDRFALLERAPDFLPVVVSVLSTLFDRLELEGRRTELDADARAQTLSGLQIFYLRGAADSLALLQVSASAGGGVQCGRSFSQRDRTRSKRSSAAFFVSS